MNTPSVTPSGTGIPTPTPTRTPTPTGISARSRTFRRAGTVLALTGFAGLASGAGGAALAAPVVDLAGAGAGDTIELPVPYEVGQSASTSATFDTTLDISGGGADQTISFAFQLDLTSTVDGVDGEGGAVVDSTIDVAEWIEQPEGLDDDVLAGIVGVEYSEVYDPTGNVQSREIVGAESLSAEQLQVAEEFIGQSESVAFGFPEEPVGVGATWTSDATVDSNDLEFPVTYQYELVSLDDESYTIAVTYDSPIDAEVEGADLTGQITGAGTLTGAVDNPLELAFEFEQDANFTAEQGGDTIDMQMNIVIDNQVTTTASVTVDTGGSDAPADSAAVTDTTVAS